MKRYKSITFLSSAVFSTIVLILFLTGPIAYSINEEDNEKSADIAQRMAMPPQAEKKYTEFIEKVSSNAPRVTVPEGEYHIREIRIIGEKLLSQKTLSAITNKYRNRKLLADDIRKCVEKITTACHAEGWLTSIAEFWGVDKDGVLTVMIYGNKIGNITIKGNKHFKNDIILKRLDLKTNNVFNLHRLQEGAFKIGRSMDRKDQIDLKYNEDTALTDIMINVKDRPPVHLTLEVDNYGSWYIRENRYKIITTHNNITGNDDALQLKMQWADKSAHELFDITYRLPINNKWWWEYYFMPYKAEDYFHSSMAGVHKRAWKTFTYLHYNFLEKPGKSIIGEIGFVYKHINWEKPVGTPQKMDHFSGVLLGIDMDFTDKYGRTIITDDFEGGIPNLFGSTKNGLDECSVPGADGAYMKNHLVIARRQKLFPGTDFLFKTHAQVSDATLTGVNSFSIGGFYGVIDMRGYPRATVYGDSGVSFSSGFSFVPYFLPKDLKVPGSKATFYQSTQFFTLIDWATCEKLRPPIGEPKSATLYSAVAGTQMMLPEAFLFRLEVGWPLSDMDTPDGRNHELWLRVSKTF